MLAALPGNMAGWQGIRQCLHFVPRIATAPAVMVAEDGHLLSADSRVVGRDDDGNKCCDATDFVDCLEVPLLPPTLTVGSNRPFLLSDS